jgi:Protein of unknown function (DUF3352)
MRRLLPKLALLACLAPVALAGCGGDEESSSPLDAGLAHLPNEAPLAVAIDTDLEGDQYKALDSILGKFPLEATSVRELLRDQLGGGGSGVDFERDIEPILGNPLVIGAADASSLTGSSSTEDLVIALQAKDQGALDDLIEKSGPEEIGEVAGATKYEDGGTTFAVDGDVVVIASSEGKLDRALERADGDDHLDADTFEAALDGLPDSALARAYADLEALLASQPGGRQARRSEWIGALRTLGLAATARDDGVEVEFNLRTDPEGLTDQDLPIAAGDESPPVISRDGEIGFGIRDPAQIVRFAEAAGQAIDPRGFADYARARRTIDARLDISIDEDLIGQLGGDLSASVAPDGGFGVRAELKDPTAFERTLAKIAGVLPSFARGAGLGAVRIEKPAGGDDLYAARQADGDAVFFGVLDDVLVVAGSLERARELVSEEPEPVDGAEGAVVTSSDAEELANAVIRRFGPALGLGGLEGFGAQLFTGPLGDLGGSVSASTDGLRGRVELEIE